MKCNDCGKLIHWCACRGVYCERSMDCRKSAKAAERCKLGARRDYNDRDTWRCKDCADIDEGVPEDRR